MNLRFSSSHSDERTAKVVRDLKVLLETRASDAQIIREHHSHGESYHEPSLPDVVCFPTTTEEVSEIVKISAVYGIPVIPFGSGTSLEGQVNALHGGITISLREMKRIIKINVKDSDAAVEAGVTRKQLNGALRDTGLTFLLIPAQTALSAEWLRRAPPAPQLSGTARCAKMFLA